MSSTGGSGVARLRVICGPTAAGKSALVARLAARVSLGIISADSRQVYRGFDIGTAKPTREQRAQIPHFGLDVADPTARYSAAHWAAEVPGWVERCRALGREPVVVGGTGFYLRALFDPLFSEPPVDEARRSRLRQHLDMYETEELRRWCQALDPARSHLGRTQLLRAIETALLTGHRISDLHRVHGRAPSLAGRYLLIDRGRALADAITVRVDDMLAAGWLEETRDLVARVPGDAPAWTATGYDALRQVVGEGRSTTEARQAIVVATRQYAKRQRTWFRHQLDAADTTWLDANTPDALDRLLTWWGGTD